MKFTKEDIGKKVQAVGDDRGLYPFKEGIICHEGHDRAAILGIDMGETPPVFGINVGEGDGMHDCDETCDFGAGLWVFEEDFELF